MNFHASRFALIALAVALSIAGCATRRAAPVEERLPTSPRVSQPQPPPPPVAPSQPPPARVAEPDWRPPTYTVKRGDTLQAIALEHGLDYRELAMWNAIENPNRIHVGQVLQLAAPGGPGGDASAGVVTAPLRTTPPVVESRTATAPSSPTVAAVAPSSPTARNTETLKVSPKAVKERYTPELAREMAKVVPEPVQLARAEPSRPPAPSLSDAPPIAAPAPPPAATPAPSVVAPPKSSKNDDGDDLDWIWPAKGKLVTGFSDTANLKGIDIAGTAGQPVVASAPGRVVYAGSGLRGYGKLVIIKHNNTFLSAYAHNRDIVVKEGQEVTRGQKIAEMGSTDTDSVKLHFEIRRLGRPMDPLKYLPPA
jgi:lipoprotein NlpD